MDALKSAVLRLVVAWAFCQAAPAWAADGAEPAVSTESGVQASHGEAPPATPAASVPPRHSIIYRSLTALRINPGGLIEDFTVGYRRQIVPRSELIFRDTFLLAGVQAGLTPALARVGPRIEVQPLAILNLSARYELFGSFGVLSQLQSWPSATSDWGPKDLTSAQRRDQSYATYGHMLTLGAVFQIKVGKIAARSDLQVGYAAMKLRNADRVFYDQTIDMLRSGRGWALVHDFDLAYIFDFGLTLAARHTATHGFYTRRDFRPQEPVSQPNGPTSRLGPAIAYTFFDRPGSGFNRPTLILLSQWWLRHRYRTGAQSHAAIPYLAVAFSCEGELWPRANRRKRSRARTSPSGRHP